MSVDFLADVVGAGLAEKRRPIRDDVEQRTHADKRSWLLDLCTDALGKNSTLKGIAPYVVDSGEGRWTVDEAIDLNVPALTITAASIKRLRSRDADSFSDKLLSAMRNEFGGHAMKSE